MTQFNVSIKGIPEAQAAFEQAARAVKPSGAYGKWIKETTLRLHKYAVDATHVDTGALKASHILTVNRLQGEIMLNPGARRGDEARPAHYGPFEHRRGGSHAFYARTIEHGNQFASASSRIMLQGLP